MSLRIGAAEEHQASVPTMREAVRVNCNSSEVKVAASFLSLTSVQFILSHTVSDAVGTVKGGGWKGCFSCLPRILLSAAGGSPVDTGWDGLSWVLTFRTSFTALSKQASDRPQLWVPVTPAGNAGSTW